MFQVIVSIFAVGIIVSAIMCYYAYLLISISKVKEL